MAPELVRAERGEDGWRKADVWGIGCVLVELVTGKPPWVRTGSTVFLSLSKNV
jgi:hypothetical protein